MLKSKVERYWEVAVVELVVLVELELEVADIVEESKRIEGCYGGAV